MEPLHQLPIPLLEWYRDNARRLPWRDEPTAYHVWVSEVMLQQTRVAAVLDYYRRFMAEVPDVAALAALPEELMDYVTLHELVHFLHPNHGPGFYAVMDRLMPDWKEKRARLKGCALQKP